MSVLYTASEGGSCAAEAQRRVAMLVTADQEASSTVFPYPHATVALTTLSNNPVDFVGGIVNALGVTVPTTYGLDLVVAARTTAEVSVDYAVLYNTVTDPGKVVPLVGAFTGSPFILEHNTMQYDDAAVLQTLAVDAVLLPRTDADAVLAGTYVAGPTVQFRAVGSRMVARIIGDASFVHRFTLRWVYMAGDWNVASAGGPAGGWQVQPYANPFASGAATIAPPQLPPLITFNVRVMPE